MRLAPFKMAPDEAIVFRFCMKPPFMNGHLWGETRQVGDEAWGLNPMNIGWEFPGPEPPPYRFGADDGETCALDEFKRCGGDAYWRMPELAAPLKLEQPSGRAPPAATARAQGRVPRQTARAARLHSRDRVDRARARPYPKRGGRAALPARARDDGDGKATAARARGDALALRRLGALARRLRAGHAAGRLGFDALRFSYDCDPSSGVRDELRPLPSLRYDYDPSSARRPPRGSIVGPQYTNGTRTLTPVLYPTFCLDLEQRNYKSPEYGGYSSRLARMDVDFGARFRAPGTAAMLYRCDRSTFQDWEYVNGTVRNVATGLCLGVSSYVLGAQLVLLDCADELLKPKGNVTWDASFVEEYVV